MNDEKVVEHMIEYITEEEKKLINQKYLTKSNPKNTIAKNMIIELERVMADEDM